MKRHSYVRAISSRESFSSEVWPPLSYTCSSAWLYICAHASDTRMELTRQLGGWEDWVSPTAWLLGGRHRLSGFAQRAP